MNIKYRPEIDGLRSLAVFAVLLYHIEFTLFGNNLFTGGFVGVDIFFVISGYLITSIIKKELITNNSFSFKNFYLRRVRRILPLLLFISIFFLLLSYFFLSPTHLSKFTNSVFSSILFSSNFYFLLENIDYGNNYSHLMPFLHTWSLSVEEQYYLLFPVIYCFFFKYFKTRLTLIFTVFLFFSLFLNNISSFIYRDNLSILSFYMLPFRLWEILAGSLVCLVESNVKKYNLKINNIIIFLSLLFIFYAISSYDINNIKPFWHMFAVVFSTSLIILLIDKEKNIFKRIFSSWLLVKLGLISFSIYLWHYCLIAFFRLNDLDNLEYDLTVKISVIFLSIILSFISYRIIEKPFRNKNLISNKNLFIYLSINLIVITSFLIASNLTSGFKFRYNNFYESLNYEFDNKKLQQDWNKDLFGFYSKNSSKFKNINKENILIIGNSHAVGYFNMLNLNKELYPNKEFALLRIGMSDLEKYKDQIDIFKKSNTLVIASRYPFSNYNKEMHQSLEKYVLSWKQFSNLHDKKLIFFLNRPEFSEKNSNNYLNADIKLYPSMKKNLKVDQNLINQLSNNLFIEQNKSVELLNKDLKNLLVKNNIKYFDPKVYSCDTVIFTCHFLTNNKEKIYWDYGHYTLNGSKFFGTNLALRKFINNTK